MMTTAMQEKTTGETESQIPPSVLLIGRKRTLDYVAPALYRINNTGELIIKATGSLSIVTAVDVAEIVKRDVTDIATQSITVGTDQLRVATGEMKRMSSIEIHLIKVGHMVVAAPSAKTHEYLAENKASTAIEILVEENAPNVTIEVPVTVIGKSKKKKIGTKRESVTRVKKKSSKKKKRQEH